MARRLYFIVDADSNCILTDMYERKRDLLRDFTVKADEALVSITPESEANFDYFWADRIPARPLIREADLVMAIMGILLGIGVILTI